MNKVRLNYFFGKAGFSFLAATLFLISYPRFISLYTIGSLLGSGLVLWILNFKINWKYFIENRYLILPPIVFFIIQLASLVLQKGKFSLLEAKLLFFLVPILGFPVFIHDFLRSKYLFLFKIYIIGLLTISVFLLLRISCIILSNSTSENSILEYLRLNGNNLINLNFSVLEHPTYLSMKINFALILLFSFLREWRLKRVFVAGIYILFSVMIYMLASRAGLIVWAVISIVSMLRFCNGILSKWAFYLLFIPIFLFLTYYATQRIMRVKVFINTIEIVLTRPEVDLKDFDQRSREWFCAINLIKENPITGLGLRKVEDSMVNEYMKYGFRDEADLHLNAHNQFLEAQLTFGIAGSVSLLFLLLAPFFFSNRINYKRVIIYFISLISFYLLFESMFNRQWGIMFFILFYCILIINKKVNIE